MPRGRSRLGLADVVLPSVEFLDDAIAWLAGLIADGGAPRSAADLSDAAEVCRRARFAVDDAVHGAALAPYRALDLIAGAATWSVEDGYRAEEDALADLLPGPQAQASVYAYGLIERRVKRGVGIPEASPAASSASGSSVPGLMATQLATLFLRRLEVPVVIGDVDEARVEQAIEAIRGELTAQVARGRLPEARARFLGGIVSGRTGVDHYAGCDLVLEAVFEEMAVKRQVLGDLEDVVDPGCLLLTNTSSLSVTGMGEALRHPGRLAGMHFFNPVALLPLVELVRTPATDDVTAGTAWEITGRLGKRPVLVERCAGFVVNRLLTRHVHACSCRRRARQHAVGDADEAVLRLGLPMPPSMLLAMVGPASPTTCSHTLHVAFPDRFPLSPTLRELRDGERRTWCARARRRRPSRRSTTRCWKRSPTSAVTSLTRASLARPRTSTPACCSAPGGRSSWVGSRDTWTSWRLRAALSVSR